MNTVWAGARMIREEAPAALEPSRPGREIDSRLQMGAPIVGRGDLHIVGGPENGGHLIGYQIVPGGQDDMLGIGGYDVSRRIGNVGDKRDEVSDAQQRLQGAERGKAVVRNLTGGALGSCRPSRSGRAGGTSDAGSACRSGGTPLHPWARSPQSYPSGRLRQALRSGRWDRYSPQMDRDNSRDGRCRRYPGNRAFSSCAYQLS